MKYFHDTMMRTAMLWAKESHCKKRQIGAILARNGRILCTGVNGTKSGQPNNCESPRDPEDVEARKKEFAHLPEGEFKYHKIHFKTNPNVIHAEANLIDYADSHYIAMKDCIMYVTTSPCLDCAEKIAKTGIIAVHYTNLYKDTKGIDYLHEKGIKTRQHKISKFNIL